MSETVTPACQKPVTLPFASPIQHFLSWLRSEQDPYPLAGEPDDVEVLIAGEARFAHAQGPEQIGEVALDRRRPVPGAVAAQMTEGVRVGGVDDDHLVRAADLGERRVQHLPAGAGGAAEHLARGAAEL